MSDDPLTCPFCNARQPLRPGLAIGQKLVCARCGEVFALRRLPAEDASAIMTPPVPAMAPPGKPVRANRLTAAIILGTMAVMAGAGLTYALVTVQTRRGHDEEVPRKPRRLYDYISPQPIPGDAVSPWLLAGLRYLPPRTGLLAGVQVTDLLASPAGKEWRSQRLKVGNMDVSLGAVREWTGLELEDIDHVLLGVVVRDLPEVDLTPPVHLVVRTRKPYDAKRVRLALKAEQGKELPTPEGGKRTIYTATIRNLPAALWLADNRTLVLGLLTRLEHVPGKPHDGLNQLPVEVQQLMTKRLYAGVPVWLVGHASDWKKTVVPVLTAQAKDVPLAGRLELVSSFAVWLAPEKPPQMHGAFRCIDEKAATKIADEELAPRQKERPERLKYSREGDWLSVQVKLEGG